MLYAFSFVDKIVRSSFFSIGYVVGDGEPFTTLKTERYGVVSRIIFAYLILGSVNF